MVRFPVSKAILGRFAGDNQEPDLGLNMLDQGDAESQQEGLNCALHSPDVLRQAKRTKVLKENGPAPD